MATQHVNGFTFFGPHVSHKCPEENFRIFQAEERPAVYQCRKCKSTVPKEFLKLYFNLHRANSPSSALTPPYLFCLTELEQKK